MNIERVEFAIELLKKSGQVGFWIDKEVYEYNNLEEIVDKIKKQYGLIVNLFTFENKVCIIVKVEQ